MAIIFPRLRIAYFNVPKVASTSVKEALHRAEFRCEGTEVSESVHHALMPNQIFREPIQTPAFSLLDGYWKFAVVRDPISRLIAVYANRVLQERDLLNPRYARLSALRHRVPLKPSFETFIRKFFRYRIHSEMLRVHSAGLSRYLGDDPARFDHVFRVEDLDTLAVELSERTGETIHFGRANSSRFRVDPAELPDDVIEAMARITEADYRYLDGLYPMPEPFRSALSPEEVTA